MRSAPVPEMDCVMTTRSSLIAAESPPYASRAAALVKAGTPVMPAYSLSACESTTFLSAVRTDGSTYGLPWSSRYAPTPRLIFCSKLSALKASVIPVETCQSATRPPLLWPPTKNGLRTR